VTTIEDLQQAWCPTEVQLRTAKAIMADDPDVQYVMVGLALPGKCRGVWVKGQQVEPVPGFWTVRDGAEHSQARELADRAAGQQLGSRVGATSHVTIYLHDGEPCFAAFEGIYGNREAA
jgi:hypothetical protein